MKVFEKLKNNFNLNGVDQVYFWKSEWEDFDPHDRLCTVSLKYLLFRFLFSCYFIGATAYNMTCSNMSYYFIFLTNWTFTLQLIYSLFYLIRLVWVRFQRREIEARLFTANTSGFSQAPVLPWPEKIIWIFINVVSVIPYGVSLIYWIFLFKADSWSTSTTCENTGNLLVHALNSVMALLDTGVMAVPIRISHMIFPITVAILYTAFSGFYEVAGGTYTNVEEYIYSILDWKDHPGMALLTSFGGTVLALVGHAVACWGAYRLRVLVVNKHFTRGQSASGRVRPDAGNTANSQSNFAYSNPGLVTGDESKGSGYPVPKVSYGTSPTES